MQIGHNMKTDAQQPEKKQEITEKKVVEVITTKNEHSMTTNMWLTSQCEGSCSNLLWSVWAGGQIFLCCWELFTVEDLKMHHPHTELLKSIEVKRRKPRV